MVTQYFNQRIFLKLVGKMDLLAVLISDHRYRHNLSTQTNKQKKKNHIDM